MLDLYKNIRTLRLENGWSQNELAKRAGYKDRSAIAHIEDGTVDLPQSKIKLFADIFGVTPSDLFGQHEPLFEQRYLTEDELAIITAYRSMSHDQQKLVCKMCGVNITAGDIPFK